MERVLDTLIHVAFMAICLTLLLLAHKFAPVPDADSFQGNGCFILLILAPAIFIGIMYPISVAHNVGSEMGIVGRLSQVVSTGALVLAVLRGWIVVLFTILLCFVGAGVLWILGVI